MEPKFLDIGTVAFGQSRTLTVRLQNLGNVDAAFYYVSLPRPRGGGGGGGGSRVTWDDDQPLCPAWLRLVPEEGTVEAGGWWFGGWWFGGWVGGGKMSGDGVRGGGVRGGWRSGGWTSSGGLLNRGGVEAQICHRVDGRSWMDGGGLEGR